MQLGNRWLIPLLCKGLYILILRHFLMSVRCSWIYQPLIFSRCVRKSDAFCCFVRISAKFSCDLIGSTVTRSLCTSDLKWWYITLRCRVRGLIFGTLLISSAASLSSKILHRIFGFKGVISFLLLSSSIRYVIDLTKRVASDKAISLLSAVNSAIMVCNLKDQYSGALARKTMKPDRDRAVSGSCMECLGSQFPAKSASTKQVGSIGPDG